ncbi:TD and POZ domain-containing protein 3-like isoform X2 [Dreissena polymorpha]|uniref:TD and POZ domain-containing protein 3-like isoform X2 n=1 Tax=Dreissena polymorpha TaxID=45954 RepID=UPI0022644613|nr:TD and POZ domain-containing protein 3-like isoform X2 [Dreissena polymorpha]
MSTCIARMDKTSILKLDVSDFGQSNDMADVTLIVGDIRIPVVKAVLSMASPVFQEMFKNEVKEKTATEIPLPGKDADSFITFLRCFYPNQKEPITAKSALSTLPLACEYQVSWLADVCENRILEEIRKSEKSTTTCKKICEYLKYAEIFNRSRLVNLSVDVLSEYSLNERDEALIMHNISENNKWNITRLACRKLELFQTDTKQLMAKLSQEKTFNKAIANIFSAYGCRSSSYDNSITWEHTYINNELTPVRWQLDAKRMAHEFGVRFDTTLIFDKRKCTIPEIFNCEEYKVLPYAIKMQLERELLNG